MLVTRLRLKVLKARESFGQIIKEKFGLKYLRISCNILKVIDMNNKLNEKAKSICKKSKGVKFLRNKCQST